MSDIAPPAALGVLSIAELRESLDSSVGGSRRQIVLPRVPQADDQVLTSLL